MDDKSPLKGAWFCSRGPFFAQLGEVLSANARTTDFVDRTYGA